jgi:hypothetical protein
MGEPVLDVADEAQGDVERFAVDPAGAPDAAAHEFKLESNVGGISRPVKRRGMLSSSSS